MGRTQGGFLCKCYGHLRCAPGLNTWPSTLYLISGSSNFPLHLWCYPHLRWRHQLLQTTFFLCWHSLSATGYWHYFRVGRWQWRQGPWSSPARESPQLWKSISTGVLWNKSQVSIFSGSQSPAIVIYSFFGLADQVCISRLYKTLVRRFWNTVTVFGIPTRPSTSTCWRESSHWPAGLLPAVGVEVPQLSASFWSGPYLPLGDATTNYSSFFVSSTPPLWNSLSESLVGLSSYLAFKRHLKLFLQV